MHFGFIELNLSKTAPVDLPVFIVILILIKPKRFFFRIQVYVGKILILLTN